MIPEARRHLERLFRGGAVGHLGDAQLLELFLHHRDAAEVAFTVLVQRHGPMVLRACRSVLLDPNDAHDAFQATFLTFVRKADSVRNRESVGSWLTGVALRLSKRMRVESAKRRARERQGAVRVAGRERAVPDADETGCPELLEEIGGLPEVFRVPVELCYLQGLSTEEAARRLGCPRGTVLSRLARGRERLRQRLVRRGVSFGIVLKLDGLAGPVTRQVPDELLTGTVASAMDLLRARAAGGLMARLARWLALHAVHLAASALIGAGVLAHLVGREPERSRPVSPPPPGRRVFRAGLTDPAFGEDGVVPIRLPGELTRLPPALAVQPDGKVLVLTALGRFGDSPRRHVVVRYRADGQLDDDFGDDGIAAARFVPEGP